MATPLTPTDFVDALDLAAGTSAAIDYTPTGLEQQVFWIGNYPAVGATGQAGNIPMQAAAYNVLEVQNKTWVVGGATKLQNQANTTCSDNTTTVANANFPTGAFNHTASYVGTTAATQIQRFWEFYIERVSDPNQKIWVHMSEITNEAGINVFIAANIATWNS